MATLESVNGKAPSNAQVGDIIVTNGGSFQITGGTPGNWTSQKVSDTSKNNYNSSSSNSGYYDPNKNYTDEIKIATDNLADVYLAALLEQQRNNKIDAEGLPYEKTYQYAAFLPGGSAYGSGIVGSPDFIGNSGGTSQIGPQNQSNYLKEMYAAYLEQQREALKQAYENNLSSLQAEQDKLSANYQSARNDTAAQSALSQQRYNETAAAYGLNSGTAGQAALSYSNQLQSDISALQSAESAANAEIERQRTNLAKEYESAMVQAQAENNYQLFDALYQEAVRVDQALQQQSQFNAQQTMQQYQLLLDKYYQDKQWGFTQEQWQYQQQQDQYEKDLSAAELLAAAGDYSAYGKLFGWDQAKIDQMNNAWKMANTITSSSGAGGGGGSSGGGGSGSSFGGSSSGSGGGYEALFQAAMQSGYPESYINNNYKNFGFSSKTGLYDDYLSWYEKNSSTTTGQTGGSDGMNSDHYRAFVQSVMAQLASGKQDAAYSNVKSRWHELSADQQGGLQNVLAQYGLNYEG